MFAYKYTYIYCIDKVCIWTEGLCPVLMFLYSRKEVDDLIKRNFLHTYLLPILKEARKHFPQEA